MGVASDGEFGDVATDYVRKMDGRFGLAKVHD